MLPLCGNALEQNNLEFCQLRLGRIVLHQSGCAKRGQRSTHAFAMWTPPNSKVIRSMDDFERRSFLHCKHPIAVIDSFNCCQKCEICLPQNLADTHCVGRPKYTRCYSVS